jgi:hypothetical protein
MHTCTHPNKKRHTQQEQEHQPRANTHLTRIRPRLNEHTDEFLHLGSDLALNLRLGRSRDVSLEHVQSRRVDIVQAAVEEDGRQQGAEQGGRVCAFHAELYVV